MYDDNDIIEIDNDKKLLTFKVVKLGSFFQSLTNGKIVNRPHLVTKEGKQKWGNEYILYSKEHEEFLYTRTFFGKLKLMEKGKYPIKCLHLVYPSEVPFVNPEYFILTIEHTGARFDKGQDMYRFNPDTYSQIFSSAYHMLQPDTFQCQTTVILRNDDEIFWNGDFWRFSAVAQKLENSTKIVEKEFKNKDDENGNV